MFNSNVVPEADWTKKLEYEELQRVNIYYQELVTHWNKFRSSCLDQLVPQEFVIRWSQVMMLP